ncbi:MAG: MMPL family transporter [Candidatus Nanopelagicaceae bacterium]|jgi:RND superfamily putative drug exporter|nr:MMPL family transporter [Candidatus Nanopelagicaceae bacterium]
MFEKLGQLAVRRSKLVLTSFIITMLAAGGVGLSVFGKLDSGGYSDPNSESMKVWNYFQENLKTKDAGVILIVDGKNKSVNDPNVVADAIALEKEVATVQGVESTLSYWSSGNQQTMVSKDGNAAYLLIYTKSDDFAKVGEVGKEIQSKFDGEYKSLQVYASGNGVITSAINGRIAKDLALAEAISIPLTFILLIFVFGAVIASAMPLFVGIFSILGAFFLLLLITQVTSVSVFALNLITGLGLGLGIDYSLLMVNRFREELHNGKEIDEAVVTTVKTAGKTVFYSGLTVAVTLGSMVVFPQSFLKSFGYAGVSVVLIAIVAAILPLPALMKLLGHRVDKFVVRKSGIVPKSDGRWAQTARFVMRKPVSVVVLSLVILGVMAAPIKDIVFSQLDARVLPKSDKAAIAYQVLSDRFPGQESSPIEILIPGAANKVTPEELNNYVTKIQQTEGIVRVIPFNVGNDIRIQAIQSMGSRTIEASDLIHKLRDLDSPQGTLIGGVAADFTDSQDGTARALPWALGWIAISVLILIFVFTGSVILPIKAVLLNILSLAATLGVITWIFIDGHLKWLVGDFTVTGTIDTGTAILIAVVVFGLSMDYELFLLSRIKEEHLAGHNNIESVAVGLQKSARIITAAALLLAAVFASFMTSGVTAIKMMGFGTAFAVLLDATLVRALLVPALMRLFGERNWWGPKFLKKYTLDH